ncbi:uncharacterized protein PRCAT00001611001 [Priceomyces carsonii]|uniref:uncharacterized protein n=1 Tax=Priceomyces carsonii TaxID=28549 RepID=UPI002ED7CC70|nr:unnamed protein product [Priceomyces carsonii]
MISLVSSGSSHCGLLISVRLVSSATRKASDKISVQLLKDHSSLGSRGEIIKVRPAFMRNYLHKNNGACYITKDLGPRIPVVEKRTNTTTFIEPEKEQIMEKNDKDEPVARNAMSLDELSTLFNNMRSSKRSKLTAPVVSKEQQFETSGDELLYTSSELRQAIPRKLTLSLNKAEQGPINKSFLSSWVYNMSGIGIPLKNFKIFPKGSDEQVSEIHEPGEYVWVFETPGESETFSVSLLIE